MTERTEERFNVYTKSRNSVGPESIAPLELVDFVVGGSYDTSNYKYTVLNAGTYLIGISVNKSGNNSTGTIDIMVSRSGQDDFIINRRQLLVFASNSSINQVFMFKLEAGDILYAKSPFGNPVTNISTYTSDDIKNSFWGIRLDY